MIRYPEGFVPDIYDGNDSFRYSLGKDGYNVLFCISINPSSADKSVSDPTMNSLINISRRHGFDGCLMLNPAPYRSASPSELPRNPCPECLENNMKIIEYLFSTHANSTILCGWGDYAIKGHEWFRNSLSKILKLADKYGMNLVAIKLNRSGQPAHISYLNRDHEHFCNGNGDYELKQYNYSL